MVPGSWVTSDRLIDDSRSFAGCCKDVAEELGIRFADSGLWDVSLAYDGVHFTEQGHKAFAEGLMKALE